MNFAKPASVPAKPAPEQAPPEPPPLANKVVLALGASILVAGIIAYWTSIRELVRVWSDVADYSHGFLVVPLALGFLWLRRASCPGFGSGDPWLGLPLFALSLAIRYLDYRYFLEFLEGWSLLMWVASVVLTLGGRKLFLWSLPSIGFLVFMIPLPFSLEHVMSMPLQKLATKISTWSLQVLGQPAFAEGNVIMVGDHKLEVARACSGLRLFVSVTALAYVYLVVVRRPWWEKGVLVAALPVIAVVANCIRIVTTGLLYQITDSESIHKLAHDSAGWGMILIAAAMFWLVLWYLKLLIREETVMDTATLIRSKKGRS